VQWQLSEPRSAEPQRARPTAPPTKAASENMEQTQSRKSVTPSSENPYAGRRVASDTPRKAAKFEERDGRELFTTIGGARPDLDATSIDDCKLSSYLVARTRRLRVQACRSFVSTLLQNCNVRRARPRIQGSGERPPIAVTLGNRLGLSPQKTAGHRIPPIFPAAPEEGASSAGTACLRQKIVTSIAIGEARHDWTCHRHKRPPTTGSSEPLACRASFPSCRTREPAHAILADGLIRRPGGASPKSMLQQSGFRAKVPC
jgi:hypothetical protein